MIRKTRARPAPFYGKITRGEFPCVCPSINGLHRHLIRVPAAHMPEHELLRVVVMLCTVYDVLAYHEGDSRLQPLRGWPDLVLVGQRGVIWRELKSHYGSSTPEQRRIGSRLLTAGEDWAVWRPADLIGTVIETRIASIALCRESSRKR